MADGHGGKPEPDRKEPRERNDGWAERRPEEAEVGEKKRNAPDMTGRNNNARKTDIARLRDSVREHERRIKTLEKAFLVLAQNGIRVR